MRVLIAGGGTGGHLYPGIAVADELMRRDRSHVVSFVGTARGLESRAVPARGYGLDLIRSAGLKGKALGALLRGLWLLPLSAIDAWRVLSRRTPDVVVGVGGYSSGPVLLLAAARGIPTLLMEQNTAPGFTNRCLAHWVSAAAVSFEATLPFFPGIAFVSGNPVRREFLHPNAPTTRVGDPGLHPNAPTTRVGDPDLHPNAPTTRVGDPGLHSNAPTTRIGDPGPRGAEAVDEAVSPTGAVRVLIMGGSQGARAINDAAIAAAPRLAASGLPLTITHQTGERDLARVRDGYARAGVAATAEAFFHDMDARMRGADLVVARAGASTLAEVTVLGRPSVLVPLPTAADDHQRKNARVLAAAGAAEVIDEPVLTGERLAQVLVILASDGPRRARMAAAALALATPDAAARVADRIATLARCR